MAILEALKIGAGCCFYIYACWYLARLIIRDHRERQAPSEPEAQEEPEAPVDVKREPACTATTSKYIDVKAMEKYHEALRKYIDEKTQQHEKKAADPAPEDTTTDKLAPCPICHSEVSAELQQWPGFKKLTITCDRCGLSFENSQDFSSYTTAGGKIGYVATSEDPIIIWNRTAGKGRKQQEIVRCKDCKHWSYAQSINRHECNIFNGAYDWIGYPTKEKDFCSYGERKEEKHEQTD